MRTYYIFFIDQAFLTLYRDKPNLLYRNFYQIYKMSHDNYGMGIKIYSQLITPFNKKQINEYIYNKHNQELSYTNHNYTHIINNRYTHEITKLTVYNTYLKIITNKNDPYFFNTLYHMPYNVFICDFKNHDYFWLESIEQEILV